MFRVTVLHSRCAQFKAVVSYIFWLTYPTHRKEKCTFKTRPYHYTLKDFSRTLCGSRSQYWNLWFKTNLSLGYETVDNNERKEAIPIWASDRVTYPLQRRRKTLSYVWECVDTKMGVVKESSDVLKFTPNFFDAKQSDTTSLNKILIPIHFSKVSRRTQKI